MFHDAKFDKTGDKEELVVPQSRWNLIGCMTYTIYHSAGVDII
jgi:hypothetical protein